MSKKMSMPVAIDDILDDDDIVVAEDGPSTDDPTTTPVLIHPPSRRGGGATARARRTEGPDQELVKQFQERYGLQDEPPEEELHSIVGVLNVPECLEVIETHDVSFVVTDTGTGKSTLIPKALYEKGAKIVSSQPRRTATVNLALRVSDLLGEKLGENVGYYVRGERVGDDKKCRLMYMTSYTLLLHLLSHPHDFNFTHCLIDEFHERQPDVEVTLALLRLAKQRLGMSFKIVLLSASVEVDEWIHFFDGLSVGVYSTCKPRFPIHDYYQEEVCRLIGASYNPPRAGDIVDSVTLHNLLYLVRGMVMFLAKYAAPSHSILVFLPGRAQVENLYKWIQDKYPEQLEPIQWYRDVELSVIHEALRRPSTTRKKVYLATDIAEVSLTLPDVVFVIDSGTTKKPRIDVKNRNSVVFPPLELIWTSRSSVQQRRGRVGRVQQGFFFSMVAEKQLPQLREMEPQIANQRINELALHVLEVAENPQAVFNLCRDLPKAESVQLSMNYLIDGGCVMKTNEAQANNEMLTTDEALPWRETILSHPRNVELAGAKFGTTVKGKLSQHLPLSIECSSIVFSGLAPGLEAMLILAAAIVDCGTPFYLFHDTEKKNDPQARDQLSKIMKEHSHGMQSDIVAALDIAIEYKLLMATAPSEEREEEWCSERQVSSTRLRTIVQLEKQIKEQLGGVLSFHDVADPKDLQTQLKAHTRIIHFLVAASHIERAIFVTYDAATAQKERRAGPCIFLKVDALCDHSVATTVEWAPGDVVIPLVSQVRYGRLVSAFSLKVTQKEFNILLLMTAHSIFVQQKKDVKRNPEGESVPSEPSDIPDLEHINWLLGVRLHSEELIFNCDGKTGTTLLDFRDRLTAAMRVLRVMCDNKIDADNEEFLEAAVLQFEQDKNVVYSSPPKLRFREVLIAMQRLLSEEVLQQMVCEPKPSAQFRPTKKSVLFTGSPSIFRYDAPPAPPSAVEPPPNTRMSAAPPQAMPQTAIPIFVGAPPPQYQQSGKGMFVQVGGGGPGPVAPNVMGQQFTPPPVPVVVTRVGPIPLSSGLPQQHGAPPPPPPFQLQQKVMGPAPVHPGVGSPQHPSEFAGQPMRPQHAGAASTHHHGAPPYPAPQPRSGPKYFQPRPNPAHRTHEHPQRPSNVFEETE